MTIGTLFILLLGFMGGVIAGYFLTVEHLDQYREEIRFWRNEALKGGQNENR